MSSNSHRWHLVGNGSGTAEIRNNEKVIRFNKAFPWPEPSTLVISNGQKKGINQSFLVEGQLQPPNFECRLNKVAETLESLLGVRPSTGLATLFVLSAEPCNIRISCMNLFPSIARPEHLSNRKPLACCFHNWLGERRIVLPWVRQLNWPEFWLSFFEDSKLDQAINPYPSLLSLPFTARHEALALIRWLTTLPLACWKTNATEELLNQAELLFFLNRGVKETQNWWLFDYEASELMARIHRTLAVTQQILLFPVQVLPESL